MAAEIKYVQCPFYTQSKVAILQNCNFTLLVVDYSVLCEVIFVANDLIVKDRGINKQNRKNTKRLSPAIPTYPIPPQLIAQLYDLCYSYLDFCVSHISHPRYKEI